MKQRLKKKCSEIKRNVEKYSKPFLVAYKFCKKKINQQNFSEIGRQRHKHTPPNKHTVGRSVSEYFCCQTHASTIRLCLLQIFLRNISPCMPVVILQTIDSLFFVVIFILLFGVIPHGIQQNNGSKKRRNDMNRQFLE